MTPQLDAEAVYSRLREWLGLATDTALADYFGVSRQNLSNWKRTGSVQLERILDCCPDVDMDWLLLGRGKPGKPPAPATKDGKRKGEK